MAEAIRQVKRQLGREAVILHTRTRTKGGVCGLGGQSVVEVTAAAGVSELPADIRRGIVKRGSGKESTTGVAGVTAMTMCGTTLRSAPDRDPELRAEIGELRSLVQELARDTRRSLVPNLPTELVDTYTRLVQNDVAEDVAVQLVDQIRREMKPGELADPQAVRERLAAYVESMLPVAGPIRVTKRGEPTIIALIGPTGVGKTTTIAKLAANFRLTEGRKVGLITIDTYRIAAVEQLRIYAQIINVPLEVVMTPAQLRGAIETMSDCDVILLDTAGRSQKDQVKLNELKGFMDEAKPHEVHLVLAGTCNPTVLAETIERFGVIGIDRVIFTKLDEAVGFGAMLSCLSKAKAKLSYLTTGQDVPDDIEVGRGRRVAELIVDGRRADLCAK